uniref:Uncharacterized protein n=1 Tax=Nelumbo nucifera TaxID=4432 RepID=A0A822YQN3_NELNU|nr:TPA_asm: hypothetical protein HUJ06_007135 [Nelumbo nucifera]
MKTPDFLGLPNLERLVLEGRTSLVQVHNSIGYLDKLYFLNLKNCEKLRNLPHSICKLKSLKKLILSGCSKLDKFPAFSCFDSFTSSLVFALWFMLPKKIRPLFLWSVRWCSFTCTW